MKKKFFKWIFIILLVILLIFLALTFRKVLILSQLDNSVSYYENTKNNIYIKTILNSSTYSSIVEKYIKNNIDKSIIEKIDSNGNKTQIEQYMYPTERKVYQEVDGIKTLSVYQEVASKKGAHLENDVSNSYTVIPNYAYSINFSERFLSAIFTSIKKVNVDGEDCYELSGKYSPLFLTEDNCVKTTVYLEKETGLPIKLIEKINENEKIYDRITTYEIKFDYVTDENLIEPDETQYILQENN